MKNETTNVMSCGACAVVVDENGNVTTSIDQLVRGMKRLFAARRENRAASQVAAAATR